MTSPPLPLPMSLGVWTLGSHLVAMSGGGLEGVALPTENWSWALRVQSLVSLSVHSLWFPFVVEDVQSQLIAEAAMPTAHCYAFSYDGLSSSWNHKWKLNSFILKLLLGMMFMTATEKQPIFLVFCFQPWCLGHIYYNCQKKFIFASSNHLGSVFV